MESNKDEALRCLGIARKHYEAGNTPSARKFCQKSITLFETPQALQLLANINASPSSSSGSASTSSSTSSAAEEHPSAAGTKHRHSQKNAGSNGSAQMNGTAGGIGGEKREYTAEQGEVVRRVRACKVTEYYEILALKRDCDDGDIKKAYRKLALALHPDKNGAPGADEAFKLVSKAFQILSDPQKRAAYDRSGGDPEDRFGGMSNGSSFAAGSPFGEEVSPEEIFRMFFGAGGGPGFGASFGGGPVFTTTFGPGGFTTTRMGGQRHHHQHQGNANTEPRSIFFQLLPLLILFGFSLLSSLPSLFGSSPVPDPRFSFQGTSRYNVERQTGNLGVKYHVNSAELMSHPVIGPELARDGVDLGKTPKTNEKAGKENVKEKKQKRGPALTKFESSVERIYTQDLYGHCQRGMDRKERLREQEVGLFGIGTDWEKVKQIEQEVVESCEELKRLGVLIR